MGKHESNSLDRWVNRGLAAGLGSLVLIGGYDLAAKGPEETVREVVDIFSTDPGNTLMKHLGNPFLGNVYPAATLVPVDVSRGPFKVVQG